MSKPAFTINFEDYELVAHGSVICIPNKTTIFTIGNIRYELLFVDNDASTENKISFEIIKESNALRITCENFDDALGTSNTEPLAVGVLNERKLYFNYRVSSIDKKIGKLLTYTWYMDLKEGGENE